MEDILNEGDIKDFYHFEGEIGSGLTKVMSGINFESGEEVAIKVMKVDQMNEHDKKNLFQEIFILSNLKHPNIVKIIEAFQDTDEGMFYLVFELLKGGSLAESIQEYEYLNEERTKNILLNVIEAIKFMHEHDLVHRDLKPENFVHIDKTTNSNVKIIDFGMA